MASTSPRRSPRTSTPPHTAPAPDLGPLATIRALSLLLSTILLGMIGGFFYSFEVSVMRGFRQLGDAEFVVAMRAINDAVRNIHFAPSFFGAAFAVTTAAIFHAREYASHRGALVLIAATLYLLGVFGVTIVMVVPMNEGLAALGPATEPGALAIARTRYESEWVTWNLVRTVCGGLSLLAMALALWIDGYGGEKA